MSHRSTKKLASFLTFLIVTCFASVAFADEGTKMAVAANSGLIALGASLGLGIAAHGYSAHGDFPFC